ncbi:MAG: EAL domain-containing protein [Burkholderiaceae bacterium]|nr:EAL domain-containing protein [Burkholderiaceae bacterium]
MLLCRLLPCASAIKLDRMLVTGIECEEDVAMIARAAVSLGKSLRKTVVAEGVENQAQFDFLRYQGCDEFQGYLLSRPGWVSLACKPEKI